MVENYSTRKKLRQTGLQESMDDLPTVEVQEIDEESPSEFFEFSDSDAAGVDSVNRPYKLDPEAEVIVLDSPSPAEVINLAHSSENEEENEVKHDRREKDRSRRSPRDRLGSSRRRRRWRSRRRNSCTEEESRETQVRWRTRFKSHWSNTKVIYKFNPDTKEYHKQRFKTRFSAERKTYSKNRRVKDVPKKKPTVLDLLSSSSDEIIPSERIRGRHSQMKAVDPTIDKSLRNLFETVNSKTNYVRGSGQSERIYAQNMTNLRRTYNEGEMHHQVASMAHPSLSNEFGNNTQIHNMQHKGTVHHHKAPWHPPFLIEGAERGQIVQLPEKTRNGQLASGGYSGSSAAPDTLGTGTEPWSRGYRDQNNGTWQFHNLNQSSNKRPIPTGWGHAGFQREHLANQMTAGNFSHFLPAKARSKSSNGGGWLGSQFVNPSNSHLSPTGSANLRRGWAYQPCSTQYVKHGSVNQTQAVPSQPKPIKFTSFFLPKNRS